MTLTCVTPSLDCKMAPRCAAHMTKRPGFDPRYARINKGDLAVFACPDFREMPADDDGYATMHMSAGAVR